VTLVSGGGIHALRAIERFTGVRIRHEPVPTAEAVAARRAEAILERIRATLAEGPFAAESALVARLLGEGHAPQDIAAALLRQLAPVVPAGLERDEFAPPERDRPRAAPHRPPPRPGSGHGTPRPPARRKIGPRGRKKPRS